MAGFVELLLVARQERSWDVKLAGILAVTLASAAWLRAAATWFPASPAARLAATLPVVAANAAAPIVFRRDTEAVSIAFCAFILTWLSSFKALALAVGRGPLAQQLWAPGQFWALYALPLVPAASPAAALRRAPSQATLNGAGAPLHLFLRWLAKAGATAAIVFSLLLEGLPPAARSLLYVLGIYAMLGVVMDGPAALVLRPLRLRLAPHFLPPWESASLAEFWGTRWNQAAGNALRTTIYDPISECRLVNAQQLASLVGSQSASQPGDDGGSGTAAPGARRRSARLAAATAAEAVKEAAKENATVANDARRGSAAGMDGARLAGVAASFLVSGAVHEMIFVYVTGGCTRRLAWLWFFTGQVLLVLGERWLVRRCKQAGVPLPPAVRRVASLGLLLWVAHHLFFEPAEAAGVPALFAASLRNSFTAMAAAPARLAAAVAASAGAA